MKLPNSLKLISIAFVLLSLVRYLTAQEGQGQGSNAGQGQGSDAGRGQGWRETGSSSSHYDHGWDGSGHKSGSSGGKYDDETSPTPPPHKHKPKPKPTAAPTASPSVSPKK